MRPTINILIACEESQAECIAFRERGFRAFSCDVQPCRRDGHPEWHIMADVKDLLHGKSRFQTMDGKYHRLKQWHLIVAHPPCTFLCKVGSLHLYKNPDHYIDAAGKTIFVNGHRYKKMLQARNFFFECLDAQADFVAVENPIPMALADLPKPSCFVEPFWYGHKYSKKTLYWLRNLPPLMADCENPKYKSFVGASRGKYRSRTFAGVAQAIAEQWGEYVASEVKKMQRRARKEAKTRG